MQTPQAHRGARVNTAHPFVRRMFVWCPMWEGGPGRVANMINRDNPALVQAGGTGFVPTRTPRGLARSNDGTDCRLYPTAPARIPAIPFTIAVYTMRRTASGFIVGIIDTDADGRAWGLLNASATMRVLRNGGFENVTSFSNTNEFIDVCVVYDSATSFSLYKNGFLFQRSTGLSSQSIHAGVDTWIAFNGRGTASSNPLDGIIGNIRIWQRALSDADVLANFRDPWAGLRPDISQPVAAVGGTVSPWSNYYRQQNTGG